MAQGAIGGPPHGHGQGSVSSGSGGLGSSSQGVQVHSAVAGAMTAAAGGHASAAGVAVSAPGVVSGQGGLQSATSATGGAGGALGASTGHGGGGGTRKGGGGKVPPSGAGGGSSKPKGVSGDGKGAVIRMRGLPYRASKSEVMGFFKGCSIPEEGIAFVTRADGRVTGEAYVRFATREDAKMGIRKDREMMVRGRRGVVLLCCVVFCSVLFRCVTLPFVLVCCIVWSWVVSW